MTPRSLACLPYWGGCPQKYVEQRSQILYVTMDFPLQFPNGDQISKSKIIAIMGMNVRPNGENWKEIGWGIAEKHFAENT